MVAADVDVVRVVARLHVELARHLRDLLEDELRVEEDRVVLDALARLAEQVERLGLHELNPDLGEEPLPALVEGRHRIRREDVVARHLVDEHASASKASEQYAEIG